jgi:hypothetical protein
MSLEILEGEAGGRREVDSKGVLWPPPSVL